MRGHSEIWELPVENAQLYLEVIMVMARMSSMNQRDVALNEALRMLIWGWSSDVFDVK